MLPVQPCTRATRSTLNTRHTEKAALQHEKRGETRSKAQLHAYARTTKHDQNRLAPHASIPNAPCPAHAHTYAMSSGSPSASERVRRHATTALNAVFASKCPGAGLHVEDIHWWPNGKKFSAATGRPWRCEQCRSKSCRCCQAFDQISCAEATSPHHVFQTLERALNKQLIANAITPSDQLLDQLIALEDKLANQRLHTARRAGNIHTKLQALAHCAHQHAATHPDAKPLRDSQATRAVRRRLFAAHRAKRQKIRATWPHPRPPPRRTSRARPRLCRTTTPTHHEFPARVTAFCATARATRLLIRLLAW